MFACVWVGRPHHETNANISKQMFGHVCQCLEGIFPPLSKTMAKLKKEIIISSATVCAIIVERRRRRRKQQKPRLWCRSWIEIRSKYGAYNCLLKELKLSDKPSYKNFLRMTEAAFEELLQKVAPLIHCTTLPGSRHFVQVVSHMTTSASMIG